MTIFLQSRIEGAVLGAAFGDAMGHPIEFINSFGKIDTPALGPTGICPKKKSESDGRVRRHKRITPIRRISMDEYVAWTDE